MKFLSRTCSRKGFIGWPRGTLARGIVLVVGLSGTALLSPSPFACGPEIVPTVFTGSLHPDDPIEDYVGGKLGILQPTYARINLYVAYRNLSKGILLSPEERDGLLTYWQPEDQSRLATRQNSPGQANDWPAAWKRVESEVLSTAPPREATYGDGLYRMVPGDTYDNYLNCPLDAFRNAVQVFRERKERFGSGGGLVQWVEAQSQVFANCGGYQWGGANPAPSIPPALTTAAPEWLRADREYQIAAAYFYSAQFDEATARFDQIGRDASSPWNGIAPYLAARAQIRKSTLSADEQVKLPGLQDAERRLRNVLTDSDRIRYHGAAQRLLNFVRFRTEPEKRLRELSKTLQDPRMLEGRRQDMIDYKRLLDSAVGDNFGLDPRELAEDRDRSFDRAIRAAEGDLMTEWILAFQSGTQASKELAMQRWQSTRQVPWLVAAISKARWQDPFAGQLQAEAEKILPDSPAYPTVTFHAVRLLAEAGQVEDARRRLDAWLQVEDARLPGSSVNLLRAARLKLARNAGEFLNWAPRNQPSMAGFLTRIEGTDEEQFDLDFVVTVNRHMPIERLAALAGSQELPAHLHRQLLLLAWTRAVLLARHDIGLSLAEELERAAPEMRFVLRDYRAAISAEAREFAATYALLSFAGLRPFLIVGEARYEGLNQMDHWRDNWWCGAPQEVAWKSELVGWRNMSHWESWPLRAIYPDREIGPPNFLTPDERAQASRETEQLASLPAAPNFLAQRAVEWARKQPQHSLIPEALHRAVMASRWGCTDEKTGQFSRAAFELLHKRYANSSWAKRTKYWYGNEY